MLHLASKIAKKSKFHRARVGAVLVKGGRVLSTGCNRIGYSKYVKDRKWENSVHAEVQAILELLKTRRFADIAGSTLYVSRIGAGGLCRLSKPCEHCRSLITAVGIRKVIYTTNDGSGQWTPE